MKVFPDLTGDFQTSFYILLLFCVFYHTPKLIFVRPIENKSEKMFWKVSKRFVNFKTQLNHQYLSLLSTGI